MHPASVIALGFQYPTPDAAARLGDAIASLQGSPARHMEQFVSAVWGLGLGEWEELHTATLDLSPQFIPYVGDVAWGENYRRGAFMADLKVAMETAGVDLAGELPDHIEPVLRYLAATEAPLDDLMAVLPSALRTMGEVLQKADPDNPYRHLLAAATDIVVDLRPLTIGRRT